MNEEQRAMSLADVKLEWPQLCWRWNTDGTTLIGNSTEVSSSLDIGFQVRLFPPTDTSPHWTALPLLIGVRFPAFYRSSARGAAQASRSLLRAIMQSFHTLEQQLY